MGKLKFSLVQEGKGDSFPRKRDTNVLTEER
jgi:hypothetical protein